MKILALDIGDVWTGIAISDVSGRFARPYKTVMTRELESCLGTILTEEKIETVVVGNPVTMRGAHSEQTHKTRAMFERLKATFSAISWFLWDERLSSKRASSCPRTSPLRTKDEKLMVHARAAAFILTLYLEYRTNTAVVLPTIDKS